MAGLANTQAAISIPDDALPDAADDTLQVNYFSAIVDRFTIHGFIVQ